MAHLEKKIFTFAKPMIYVRYIDDLSILAKNPDGIKYLQGAFKRNSLLQFTYELNNNQIPASMF